MITSTRNPRVQAARGLRRARERRSRGLHLVEGPRAVREALAAGVVTEVFVAESTAITVEHPVEVVADHVLDHLADATTPQGIVAVARTVTARLDAVGAGALVVLDRIADPGNAGTILRTADALGAAGVVLTAGSVDAFAPKTVRAAVGSTYHLPIVTDVALAEVAAAARASGRLLVGLDAAGAEPLEVLAGRAGAVCLVLGNEAHGLAPDAVALLDTTLAIALHPRAESLNVAAAAAIAIHAATRS
ncbi:MAG: RNA methyltransferase [Nitriliruptoraceae bacterium]